MSTFNDGQKIDWLVSCMLDTITCKLDIIQQPSPSVKILSHKFLRESSITQVALIKINDKWHNLIALWWGGIGPWNRIVG